MEGDTPASSGPTVSTGDSHRLVLCGPSAQLHSDFTQTGAVDFSAHERAA